MTGSVPRLASAMIPKPSSRKAMNMVCSRPIWSDTQPKDRKSTRLNSSHRCISYAVFCLKKKKKNKKLNPRKTILSEKLASARTHIYTDMQDTGHQPEPD